MPQFHDVLGQTHIVSHLQHALLEHRVSHAYLFAGEEQSGKELIARIFTQALMCEHLSADGEPCGECPSCKKVLNDTHPDVRIVVHEKPTSIRVTEIVTQVVDDVALTPYAAKRKVYLIPDAHLMTTEAQNKLLKTLEEPPAYAHFLLLASRAEAMLQTIRSRCAPLYLRPVETKMLTRFLKEKGEMTDFRASGAARFARGNTGKALSLAGDESFETRLRYALQLFEQLSDAALYEIDDRLKEITALSEDEAQMRTELSELLQLLLRDILVCKATESRAHLILEDHWEYIRDVAQHTTYRALYHAYDALREATLRIDANVNAPLTTDMMLLHTRDALHRI